MIRFSLIALVLAISMTATAFPFEDMTKAQSEPTSPATVKVQAGNTTALDPGKWLTDIYEQLLIRISKITEPKNGSKQIEERVYVGGQGGYFRLNYSNTGWHPQGFEFGYRDDIHRLQVQIPKSPHSTSSVRSNLLNQLMRSDDRLFHGNTHSSNLEKDETVLLQNLTEPLIIAAQVQAQTLDWAFFAPAKFWPENGASVTLEPRMTPSQVIERLKPLPLDCERLGYIEKDLVVGSKSQISGPYTGSRVFMQNYETIVITSQLFPEELFWLKFERGPSPRLIGVKMFEGSNWESLKDAHHRNSNGSLKLINQLELSGPDGN